VRRLVRLAILVGLAVWAWRRFVGGREATERAIAAYADGSSVVLEPGSDGGWIEAQDLAQGDDRERVVGVEPAGQPKIERILDPTLDKGTKIVEDAGEPARSVSVRRIVYDADVVTTPPDSWSDLFDPQWAGRAAIEDIAVTGMMIGALVNGIDDPINMDESQIAQVKQYLIDHKSQFRTFWKGDAAVKSLFKSGEIVISSGYPDNAKALQKEGVNAQFAVANEGQFLWACGYGITPDVAPENLDAAYALLNYYSSPEASLYEAQHWNYQVANSATLDIASDKVIEEASLEAPFDLENAIPASPPANREAWVAAWTEVKAS